MESKKKILFILHTPPPVHGSSVVGKYIKDSDIINKSFDCCYINLGTSTSIDEIGKGGLVKVYRYLSILLQVYKRLLRIKPDVCYLAITAKGPAFYKDALLALLVKFFDVKLVFHFHNKGVSTRQFKWIDNLIYKRVFKNAEVILLSKYLYSDIQKYVPMAQVHFCPNGIPENESSSQFQVPIKNNHPVQILFLSNLLKSKGVFVLLEACRILKNKNHDFYCTFVGGIGDISENQLISAIHEFKLDNNVSYVGKKFGAEKEKHFANADIFAFPTYNETFGLVNLEAMQFFLPIVSTLEGGIPDVVEDGITGFLVPQKNIEAFASALETLIKNPTLCMEMGAAGHAKYEREFTLEIFENRMKDILESV